MTLSTSATIDIRAFYERRARRAAIVGASLTLLCVVFTLIYENFSHGAFSPHMRMMFLCPLIGCCLPGLITMFLPWGYAVSRPAFNLWNSGVATVCFGLCFRGIVNISGRFTDTDMIYWIAGGALMGVAVVTDIVIRICRARKKEASYGDQ